jgi:hypothetical protein
MSRWGRFTLRGSEDFENRMSSVLDEVSARACRILSPAVCRAMVLLGGYGRGEGGVVVTDDGERPHNNLDFLIITRSVSQADQERLKTSVQEAVQPLEQAYAIEFDVAAISESRLRRSPSLVMWYDMRFGHKTVVGDAAFVPALKHFCVERIPTWDVLNLLVNRGTLIVINDQLIAVRELTTEEKQRIVKLAMKAIIGYGDAQLYFLGRYDWSYAEKQRRMRDCEEVPESFRKLYDEAIEFRFQPRYIDYEDRDMAEWMNDLRTVLAPIHLECERKRLGYEDLTWENYPENFFRRALWEDSMSPRAWAKKTLNMMRTHQHLANNFSYLAQLGSRMLGPRGLVTAFFPVPAYNLEAAPLPQLAAQLLCAKGTTLAEIRRTFLLRWGAAVEPPFLKLAQKWDLALEKGAAN